MSERWELKTRDAQRLGFHMAFGAMGCVGMFYMAAWVIGSLITPLDDCDRGRFDRCQMKVLTDAKTGQEYLVTKGGGIIKREQPNE